MYQEDTIAAVATPPGEGGVGLIRISGPDAERILNRVFVSKRGRNGKLRSHMLYHGSVHEPDSGRVLDNVLVTVMRGPHSYTGEDVAEIHCHGGAFLVRQILGLVLVQGARHAQRGEFTKRAFLNGRIDLSQAEAVLDLIRARTDKGIDLAVQGASGLLARSVGELREELLDVLVQVEAAIDFPDEEIELLQRDALMAKIAAIREKMRLILDTYEWGKLHREGARVCIGGRPNVGKSSLLNALLDDNRAIVSAIPGTTRDVIEDALNLDGLPVVVWDTAGIRETEDAVEQIGVTLSREHLSKADAAVVVLDGSEALTADDVSLLTSCDPAKTLVAINKNDLSQQIELDEIKKILPQATLVKVSAQERTGIGELKRELREFVLGKYVESPVVLTNLRHRNALLRGDDLLGLGMQALHLSEPPEIIAVNLQEAKESLEEIVGIVTNEDILERIFSQFCIGK